MALASGLRLLATLRPFQACRVYESTNRDGNGSRVRTIHPLDSAAAAKAAHQWENPTSKKYRHGEYVRTIDPMNLHERSDKSNDIKKREKGKGETVRGSELAQLRRSTAETLQNKQGADPAALGSAPKGLLQDGGVRAMGKPWSAYAAQIFHAPAASMAGLLARLHVPRRSGRRKLSQCADGGSDKIKLTTRLPPDDAPAKLYSSKDCTTCQSPPYNPCRQDSCVLMDPACKIAVVTGGATGIGLAACYQLLKEGGDHTVIGGNNCGDCKRAVEFLTRQFGKDKASYILMDVNKASDFELLFRSTIAKYKRVDILFNNAGILEDRRWELEVDTNVKAVIRGCFLAFKYMGRDRGYEGGVVVNNAALESFQPMAGAPVYSCTKHAVAGLTECLGDPFHLNRSSVRVVGLCPGATATDMVLGAKGRQLTAGWNRETGRYLSGQPSQSIDVVGRAFTYVLRYGTSGKHYIVENRRMLEVQMPDRKKYSQLLATFL